MSAAPHNGPGFLGPGDLDDLSLLPRRFELHKEDMRTQLDGIRETLKAQASKLDDLRDLCKGIERTLLLMIERDRDERIRHKLGEYEAHTAKRKPRSKRKVG